MASKVSTVSMSDIKGDDEMSYYAGLRLCESGYDWHACWLWASQQLGNTDVVKVSNCALICLAGWSAAYQSLHGEPHHFVDLLVASPYDCGLQAGQVPKKEFNEIANEQRYT